MATVVARNLAVVFTVTATNRTLYSYSLRSAVRTYSVIHTYINAPIHVRDRLLEGQHTEAVVFV